MTNLMLLLCVVAVAYLLKPIFFPRHDFRIVKPEEPAIQFPFDAWEQAQKETKEHVSRFNRRAS